MRGHSPKAKTQTVQILSRVSAIESSQLIVGDVLRVLDDGQGLCRVQRMRNLSNDHFVGFLLVSGLLSVEGFGFVAVGLQVRHQIGFDSRDHSGLLHCGISWVTNLVAVLH